MRHEKDSDTYHFSVTWPFWTRFMLKPTVGIELVQRQYGLSRVKDDGAGLLALSVVRTRS